MLVIDDAREELFVFTEVDTVSIRSATDDENDEFANVTELTDAANDELLVFILVCKPSILVAADELNVVEV